MRHLSNKELWDLFQEIKAAEITGFYTEDSKMREIASSIKSNSYSGMIHLIEAQLLVLREIAERFCFLVK